VWTVLYHPAAQDELNNLPEGGKVAIEHAVEKLAVLGPTLPHPTRATFKAHRGCENSGRAAGEAHGELSTSESGMFS
jgi:hypothetical protein